MEFEHVVIDEETPGKLNDVCLIADVNGDGRNEVVIGGKQGEDNIVWYEPPDWRRHTVAGTEHLEAGGVMVDVNGDGRPDLVVGQEWGHNGLYWFENPGAPERRWKRRVIDDRLHKHHDQAVADVDGDGRVEIIVPSQQSRVIVYYDIPEDPRVSPWPPGCRHLICEDIEVEGVAGADLDGDGELEVVAGPWWFERSGEGWQQHPIAPDFEMTCLAVGDLNGDGRPEVVLSEGESDPARLAWFDGFPDWQMHLLREDLFHPHSLGLADFNGDGTMDLFVAEMGLGENEHPRLFVYLNQGDGTFEEVLVDDQHPTHCARAGLIEGSDLPSIVGKPYSPGRSVDLWLNRA